MAIRSRFTIDMIMYTRLGASAIKTFVVQQGSEGAKSLVVHSTKYLKKDDKIVIVTREGDVVHVAATVKSIDGDRRIQLKHALDKAVPFMSTVELFTPHEAPASTIVEHPTCPNIVQTGGKAS